MPVATPAEASAVAPHVVINAFNEKAHPHAAALRAAFAAARAGPPRLDAALRALPGMSGWRYREFINRLAGHVADARYLEVGSWAGSTLCAALAGNTITATAIDNWSQFGGPVGAFFSNVAPLLGPDRRLSVLAQDFRTVRYDAIGQHNIYMFDGPHQEQDHFDGINLALPALDRDFILIIDDWNWPWVRQGTLLALRALSLAIPLAIEVRTSLDNTVPKLSHEHSEWHNGYLLAAVTQPGPAAS